MSSFDNKRRAPGGGASDGAKKPKKGNNASESKPPRTYTVSVAIPGSLAAVASREVRTFICGQVARTCALFAVDEVVIYDDKNDGELGVAAWRCMAGVSGPAPPERGNECMTHD